MYKQPILINFPQDLADPLTALAKRVGRPRSKLIFQSVKEFLERHEKSGVKEVPMGVEPLDFLSSHTFQAPEVDVSSGTGIR